jgi:hypothetical protein
MNQIIDPKDPPIPPGATEHKIRAVVDGAEYMMYRNSALPQHAGNHGFRAVATVEPPEGIRGSGDGLTTLYRYADENNTFYNILNFLNKKQLHAYNTAAAGGDLTKRLTIGALSEEEKVEIGKRLVAPDSIAESTHPTTLWPETEGGKRRRRRRRTGKKTGKKHVVRRRRRGTRRH